MTSSDVERLGELCDDLEAGTLDDPGSLADGSSVEVVDVASVILQKTSDSQYLLCQFECEDRSLPSVDDIASWAADADRVFRRAWTRCIPYAPDWPSSILLIASRRSLSSMMLYRAKTLRVR